jgi:hypothetical protein
VADNTALGTGLKDGGGGIYNYQSSVGAVNSTIANNSAQGNGGGLYGQNSTGGSSSFHDCTIAFNTTGGAGGGIDLTTANKASLYNTLVAGNTTITGSTPNDINGTVGAASAYNLVQDAAHAGGLTNGTLGNIVGVNPKLGTLASNGGLTQTIMLLSGSPAINAGKNSLIIPGFVADQRGLPRIVNTTVDIGAVEVQVPGTPTHFAIQESPTVSIGLPVALGVTVEDDSNVVVTGFTGTVTFTSSDPLATVPTPYKFTATDAGHHNFTVTLNTLGNEFIFLTDKPDNLAAVAETDVVTPPARGAAFVDANKELFVFQNGTFTDTGAVAKAFSAGIDLAGNAEVWYLTASNELWKWDNGVLTNTGGFAVHIAAGKGLVAFSDGNNQLYTFSDGGGGFKNTGGFASRFTAGFDALGNNQIVFADGNNELFTFNVATSTFVNTGGFTKLFVAGQDAFGNNEIWFTDGNNQIWRLDNGKFTQTSGFALTITGSANGTMYFSDGINQIWQQTDFGVVTNTGGFASHISGSPATTALFFSDGINQLWEFFNGAFINTGGFASNFLAL